MSPAVTGGAKIFRERRERRGLTQTELANELDVSQATVSAWERGEARPTGAHLLDLLRVLDLDLDDYAAAAQESTMAAAVDRLAAAIEYLADRLA